MQQWKCCVLVLVSAGLANRFGLATDDGDESGGLEDDEFVTPNGSVASAGVIAGLSGSLLLLLYLLLKVSSYILDTLQ